MLRGEENDHMEVLIHYLRYLNVCLSFCN